MTAWLLALLTVGASSSPHPPDLKEAEPIDFSRVKPWPAADVDDLEGVGPAMREAWTRAGEAALASGEVGVVLLAGGLGTRALRDARTPKGTLDLALPSGRSLFALHAARLLALRRRTAALVRKAGGAGSAPGRRTLLPPLRRTLLPLLVMTSPALYGATRAHFAQHGYFGLGANTVRFFNQSTLPGRDAAGMPLRPGGAHGDASADEGGGDGGVRAPDGHGGLWTALAQSTPPIVPALQAAGIQQLFLFIVDKLLLVTPRGR